MGNEILPVTPDIVFTTNNTNSDILLNALKRTHEITFPFRNNKGKSLSWPGVLVVNVVHPEEHLHLFVDESYELTVTREMAIINAKTVLGALHALNTFSQLVKYDYHTQLYSLGCAPILIRDKPRFAWRGLLIDSSRHYLTKSSILRMIDALSATKMNVLHWHITDAESFPIVSETYPHLSGKGAWTPTAIYTHNDVMEIVKYAMERGVRVVPEFDVPGHTASWGFGDPSLTVRCPKLEHNINNIPLDPTNEHTYDVLKGFLMEMTTLFPDEFLHLGGDEVITGCWLNNSAILDYMQRHGINNVKELLALFEQRASDITRALKKRLILWQDIFDSGVMYAVPRDTIIQVWQSGKNIMQSVVDAGYYALLSAGWYLNHQTPNPQNHYGTYFETWRDFYTNDPYNGLKLNATTQPLILGGEAAMWGEQIDSNALDVIVWPRTAAVGERLWSPQSVTDINDAKMRMIAFSCRLQQIGVNAAPLAPGYCPIPPRP